MDNPTRPDGPEASREDNIVTAAAASPRQPQPLPLTIVGGFLGSGKTSLVNHILANAGDRRIAVLVNDFGEINIDAKLIVSVKGETVSLANGCICCTIRDDLLTEVIRLLELDPPPDHIVVETSGVSRPIAVAETFLGPVAQTLVDVRNLITMLDADLTVAADAGYGDLAFAQIKVADIVVINKTDLVAPKALAELRKRVVQFVPQARILETAFGIVPLELIFDDGASAAIADVRDGAPTHPRTHGDHHEHGPDGRFESWSYRSDAAWSFRALERAVTSLPKGIYRAKGIVRLDLNTGDYGVFHLTGRRSSLRLREAEKGETASTELVFIGEHGAATTEGIRAHFEQALDYVRTYSGEGDIISDLRAFDVVLV
jgi:G3E family GTPase